MRVFEEVSNHFIPSPIVMFILIQTLWHFNDPRTTLFLLKNLRINYYRLVTLTHPKGLPSYFYDRINSPLRSVPSRDRVPFREPDQDGQSDNGES